MYNEIKEGFSNDKFPEKFGNDIYYSNINSPVVNEAYSYESNLSIKYVKEGTEYYIINNKKVVLQKGFYLIVNDKQYVTCERQKIERDEGVSIFLKQNLVNDIFTSYKKTFEESLESPFELLIADGFFEGLFFSKNDLLGEFLNLITCAHRKSNPIDFFEPDLYNLTAEKLIKTHLKNLRLSENLSTVKASTRKEIFKRVNIGKVKIEEALFNRTTIDEIAKEAALSKFHFIRLFSEIFGITPYRYLLKRRIEEASEMLKNNDRSISDIAKKVGFSDLSSFSKKFKQETGITPSKYIQLA